MSSPATTPEGALAGLRVIDLTSVVMGPFATVTLADLGADVIKVESLSGDMIRDLGPRRNPGMSAIMLNLQRNKRSLSVDMETQAGREIFDALVRESDVLVTNLRPGSRDRLGIVWERLHALNPELILCTAQGYGTGTPQQDYPAYDDIVQAASGSAKLSERVDGSPRYAPYVIADKVVGLYMVAAVLAAVVHKNHSGRGQWIDVPMVDSMIGFNLVEHLGGHTFSPPHGGFGWERVMAPERTPHRTADGWICIMPYSNANWRDFFDLAGLDEMAGDERYVNANGRNAHMGELMSGIRGVTHTRSTAEWLALCRARNVPASDLLELANAQTDEYVLERQLLEEREHPSEGAYFSTRTPFVMSDTPVRFSRFAPHLGEHTAEILDALGYTPEAIAALLSEGIARTSTAPTHLTDSSRVE